MYKAPAERMTVSLRRKEAEATGKPLYRSYSEIPKGLLSATACKKIKKPVRAGEEPEAYVLNRNWLGYLPLYDRKEAENE
jgi:hypothetical protein